jgi:lipoate-protein ligase A
MSAEWRLLITAAARGPWNMAVDEAILEHIGRGDSAPTLRLYAWEPPCLSLGQAQSYSDVDPPRLHERGWDLVRRPTGGRAILHTDELTYSVTAPSDEPMVAGSLLESYNRLARGLLSAVRSLGLNAEVKAGSGDEHKAPDPVCFDVPSVYEITVGGKKLIGSAQARRREGVLQHGSLPLAGDLARITEGLAFNDALARSAAGARLLSRATTVASALGREVSWHEAADAFVGAFRKELGVRFQEQGLSGGELNRASELVEIKFGHPGWTQNAKLGARQQEKDTVDFGDLAPGTMKNG